jgi:hypothetical protein
VPLQADYISCSKSQAVVSALSFENFFLMTGHPQPRFCQTSREARREWNIPALPCLIFRNMDLKTVAIWRLKWKLMAVNL